MNWKIHWKNLHGSKKTFRNGLYASVLAVVLLAALILLNLVVRALPSKYTSTIYPPVRCLPSARQVPTCSMNCRPM